MNKRRRFDVIDWGMVIMVALTVAYIVGLMMCGTTKEHESEVRAETQYIYVEPVTITYGQYVASGGM